MVEAVLFDLDGTLADTAPDLAAATNHARQQRQLPPLPLEQLRLQASHGTRGLLKLAFDITPDSVEFKPLQQILLNYYQQHICEQTRLFEGMDNLLLQLEKRTIPWGVVTNKPEQYTVPLLQAMQLSQRASCIIGGDTCAHSKPHPAPLLEASAQLQIEPDQALYLGDDLRDMQAATAAGMPGIIAGWGYISPEIDLSTWQARANIQHPLELLDYL